MSTRQTYCKCWFYKFSKNIVINISEYSLTAFSRSVCVIVPLHRHLLTMLSVCTVLLVVAAAALSSADSDRHDSNLEICILLCVCFLLQNIKRCPLGWPLISVYVLKCLSAFLPEHPLRQASVWDQEERPAKCSEEPGGAQWHQPAI